MFVSNVDERTQQFDATSTDRIWQLTCGLKTLKPNLVVRNYLPRMVTRYLHCLPVITSKIDVDFVVHSCNTFVNADRLSIESSLGC